MQKAEALLRVSWTRSQLRKVRIFYDSTFRRLVEPSVDQSVIMESTVSSFGRSRCINSVRFTLCTGRRQNNKKGAPAGCPLSLQFKSFSRCFVTYKQDQLLITWPRCSSGIKKVESRIKVEVLVYKSARNWA